MNRGSPANAGSGRGVGTCFNEAPIHESGKCVRCDGCQIGAIVLQ